MLKICPIPKPSPRLDSTLAIPISCEVVESNVNEVNNCMTVKSPPMLELSNELPSDYLCFDSNEDLHDDDTFSAESNACNGLNDPKSCSYLGYYMCVECFDEKYQLVADMHRQRQRCILLC